VNRATRNAIASLVVQGTLLAFAVYVALSRDAFPGATTLARAGVIATAFAAIFLAGEVERLRAQVRTLTLVAAGALGGAFPRDDRSAVDLLVRALSSEDAAVREKAHKNLLRITGKELPADAQAWRTWWESAREGFVGRGPKS
jgi:hypothetical protein